ncbi:hypothetical protein CFC21_069006 [Triticum aestivum]|uniref:Ubiquitin-like domain-containing protein n=2 Tax=Triticum aestivum TaxID=4565 RepID=A0A9R1HBF7_WHEAT|nr:uncharacterized protein LOC123105968 isoform X2 [Triticum aestivum]KAF7062398.1 hypothetical protein CFC21_069006 [Triticum aestivum]
MGIIKIKLAMDRPRNRVLLADAGSDFVDVLLSFLTLPLSALQSCAIGASSLRGCLSNLCDSVDHLRNSSLLKVEACHGMLLTPAHTNEFQLCKSTHSTNDLEISRLCKCSLVMARVLHVYEQVGCKETFVGGKERYVISDDMKIKPASTSTMLLLPQAFDSDGIGHGFEEVEVSVSRTQGTDNHKATHATMTPIIRQNIIPLDQDSAGSEWKIKVFYHTREKKVMYAECNHEFVDMLLGFLTYPISCVIKNMGAGTCHLGRCFDNLYRSVTDLDDVGRLTGVLSNMMFMDPGVMPFDIFTNIKSYRALACRCPKDDNTHYCWHPELVEGGNYVVGDDLLVHQASAMSIMKHWCGIDKANVLQMGIAVGKREAVALLRALLTSETALTDVFISRLEEMQIFVKFPWGKTITVQVVRSDTIATIKSRMKDKVSMPTGCRHKLLYASRYLRDSCTVADYNITRESTITCEFHKLMPTAGQDEA